jgi:XRE family aerobic/anaerobic benzoate catabolism transcriptional regulator
MSEALTAKTTSDGNIDTYPDQESALLATIGARIKMLRTEKKMSRRALSEISGLSQRYLVQLESGTGNISVRLLHRVGEALGKDIEWLVRQSLLPGSELSRIVALLTRADKRQRSKILSILDPTYQPSHKVRRLAFVGLRGAGKSTLGRITAQNTDLPFLELNREIEKISGIPIHEVMALYGAEGYRRLELQSLKRIIESGEDLVLAVAGGIVNEPETYQYLLKNCFTIWLKARPEEHMARVRSQGDERPMAGNPDAMLQLKQLLANREPLYAKADIVIDTSGQTVDESALVLFRVLNEAENNNAAIDINEN